MNGHVIYSKHLVGGFDLQVIEAGRIWLRLTGSEQAAAVEAFWSTETSPHTSQWLTIVEIIEGRIERFKLGELSLDDAIEIWPTGWDFWGRGIPSEIADFVRSIR